MLRTATTPTGAGQVRRRRALATTIAALAAPLAAAGGCAAAAAATGPTTHFSGRIVAASGRFAGSSGAVRLVLTASTAASRVPGGNPSPIAFKLTISSPSCRAQRISPPRRCVALHGTLTGTALGGTRNPDVGASFVLRAGGRLGPLGTVTATGTTNGLGFIARGRIPLALQLRTASGRVTIKAQGPLVKGFTSPF